ncbi:Cupin domain-containing protein [Catalinimonas alkaloidigena]|uniref:Cupin domain-containing protein n=1 Tax=Catalinimonas alkaloidigena TaxID=1075417 RepID=A0A1G9H438_9BACT|nr:cupin domain-containing protein [Catalinimonas alkaloidigena]SDL07691.1 Cupin domain-containing protein [Catalinimonas alkaloidigena]
MTIRYLLCTLFMATHALAQTTPLPASVIRWDAHPAETTRTGARRQLVDERSTTPLAYLEIHATTLNPGLAPHPPHTHDDLEELVIVKEGQLRVTIGDRESVLGPGSVALALPGDAHGFTNAGTTPVTYYIFRYRSKAPMDVARGQKAGGSLLLDVQALPLQANANGGRRDYFNRATAMFSRFEMHATTLKAGLQSHAPHTHAAEEFILPLRGNVEEQIGEERGPATAGDLIFLASLVPHAITNTGDSPTEYFAFQWE